MNLLNNTILDIQMSNKEDVFALFCDNKALYVSDYSCKKITKIAMLSDIEIDKPIKLYFHHPYICVSERFGLNAFVVDIRDYSIHHFQREDYHADVSSYSIGFIERNGEALFIHQTQWNRLDITSLQTGELLTNREVWCRRTAEGYEDENGEWIPPTYEDKNYLDYFHSILHISPDYKNFLSNGWVWSPNDRIRCFHVENFFEAYDPGSVGLGYASGYNWDRPCTFIDNNTFIIAVDNDTSNLDEEELKEYEYKQLWYFKLSDIGKSNWLECYKKVSCDAFGLNNYGEVAGDLYFDKEKNYLIAISDKGGFILGVDGEIIDKYPEMARLDRNSHSDFGSNYAKNNDWKYSIVHHLFYHFSNVTKQIEMVRLD